jgi:hypothetical protein
MKKSSNMYVNFGIAFALLGILVFSLSLNRMEGFETETETKSKPKSFTPEQIKEALAQLQHLTHLAKEDTTKSV